MKCTMLDLHGLGFSGSTLEPMTGRKGGVVVSTGDYLVPGPPYKLVHNGEVDTSHAGGSVEVMYMYKTLPLENHLSASFSTMDY